MSTRLSLNAISTIYLLPFQPVEIEIFLKMRTNKRKKKWLILPSSFYVFFPLNPKLHKFPLTSVIPKIFYRASQKTRPLVPLLLVLKVFFSSRRPVYISLPLPSLPYLQHAVQEQGEEAGQGEENKPTPGKT